MLRKRPYITPEMCEAVIAAPIRSERQEDEVRLPGQPETRILRIVTPEDAETVHKAFLDRGFRQEDR